MATKTLLWDFGGTLGYRNTSWSDCLLEMLDRADPGHPFTLQQIRPLLGSGFPWHEHGKAHPSPGDADAWWRQVTELIESALSTLGYPLDRARSMAAGFRDHYLVFDRWHLVEDIGALAELRDRGWSHVILSNHVPELPAIVDHIGLGPLVDATVSLGVIGYEKPHPEAFRLALEAAGHPSTVWMIGDNPIADVAGAERAGIPAIWVRTQDLTPEYVARESAVWAREPGWETWPSEVKRTAADLYEAARIVVETDDV